MKKLASVILALVLVFAFAACSNTSKNNTTNTDSQITAGSEENQSNSSSENDSKTSASGKILVAYYSATGSTEAVAQSIANAAGADLFEITPVEPYTDDDLNWSDDNSRVSVEHNDESKRNVPLQTVTPDNWSDYDTVFVGYPIWWGIAAWPVNNFVQGNDFTGKKVIPFCTSASSGIGDSGDLLAQMAGTGDWQDGERFSSGTSSSKVESWVQNLNL